MKILRDQVIQYYNLKLTFQSKTWMNSQEATITGFLFSMQQPKL